MFEYRQVIVQMRLGASDRAIAARKLVSRTKAHHIRRIAQEQGWLDPQQSLPNDDQLQMVLANTVRPLKSSTTSLVAPYQDQIEAWFHQGIQATTMHQALVRKYQFPGSYFSVQRAVKKLKALHAHQQASTILTFTPGEAAQIDFGAGPLITDVLSGEQIKTWIFAMTLCWSRHLYAEIVTHQTVETWLRCHRHAFEFFNGVCSGLIIDNAKCAITRACYYDPVVQRAYAEYAESYGFMISACPPREPKKKGRIESAIKYLKKNFCPLRNFRHVADANEQLRAWLLETAGNRVHGSTHEKPLTRFLETERYLLKPLPDVAPEPATWAKVKVHGDCHVQFQKCRYSVPYSLIRQTVWLRATPSLVTVYQAQKEVAAHPRLFVAGQRHTLDDHLPPNALAYKMRDPQWCVKKATIIGIYCQRVIEQLFADTVLDQLRAAQGIIKLSEKYSAKRLNLACQRALRFGTVNYHSIKNILSRGLDYEPLSDEYAFDSLSDTYQGHGQYCRDIKRIIQ
tara:strand:+ start:217 stop:1749 length:1533 start_codon:yes stop_codon:yes gene_type:complete